MASGCVGRQPSSFSFGGFRAFFGAGGVTCAVHVLIGSKRVARIPVNRGGPLVVCPAERSPAE